LQKVGDKVCGGCETSDCGIEPPDCARIENATEVLDEYAAWVKERPRLGLATTGELLSELKARCEVNGTIDHKTVGGE